MVGEWSGLSEKPLSRAPRRVSWVNPSNCVLAPHTDKILFSTKNKARVKYPYEKVPMYVMKNPTPA